tara:strand:+ start:611 stop:757 length:147 start_codon:yes stop_codon:yes gene_type:complete
MDKKPDIETLLKQALDEAVRDPRYFYVACYLKPALEIVQELKEAKKPS